MKLHKQLKWLHPYLESIAHLAPIKRLDSINLTFYSKAPEAVAECHQHCNGRYSIIIRLKAELKGKIPLPYYAQEDALLYLAHELSHLKIFSHTPERLLLEALIYHQFAVTLSRLNYEDHRDRISKKNRKRR